MIAKKSFTWILILGFAMCFLVLCKKGKKNPSACNGSSTRRDIKLASDELAKEIDTVPQLISVKAIGELAVSEASSDLERQPAEKQVYQITARVDKISKHRDGDLKIKLIEGDKYINCEFPNPWCEYASESLFYKEMVETRLWLESCLDDLVGKTITITGIGFIDLNHRYPRKNADNEMELHPVLDVRLN